MSKRIKIIEKALFWNDADVSCVFINNRENKCFAMICKLLNSRELGEAMSHEQIAVYFNMSTEMIKKAIFRHEVSWHDKAYRSTYNHIISSLRSKNLA